MLSLLFLTEILMSKKNLAQKFITGKSSHNKFWTNKSFKVNFEER